MGGQHCSDARLGLVVKSIVVPSAPFQAPATCALNRLLKSVDVQQLETMKSEFLCRGGSLDLQEVNSPFPLHSPASHSFARSAWLDFHRVLRFSTFGGILSYGSETKVGRVGFNDICVYPAVLCGVVVR